MSETTPADVSTEDAVTGFFILGARWNFSDRRFSTLEAACSSVVRVDGAVIELRFNGRRRETGVRITRKVTIRAARGYHPVVEFRPTETAPDSYQVRAVWIPSGSLDLVGVDVVLSVDVEPLSALTSGRAVCAGAAPIRLPGLQGSP